MLARLPVTRVGSGVDPVSGSHAGRKENPLDLIETLISGTYDATQGAPKFGGKSMQGRERDEIAAFLEGAVRAGACSQEVAELVATAWQSIEQVLVPVIGKVGITALFKRTLHLSCETYPWLPQSPASADGHEARALATLTTELGKRTSLEAAAAGTQLLQTFDTLLTTLIGRSLAEKLCSPAWATFLSDRPQLDVHRF